MLEITFGKPGSAQCIDYLLDIFHHDYVLTEDQVSMVLEIPNASDLLSEMIRSKEIRRFVFNGLTYYGLPPEIADSFQYMRINDDVKANKAEQRRRELIADIKIVEKQARDIDARIDTQWDDIEELEDLQEIWADATHQVFQRISDNWNEPLHLEDLALQAGFDMDNLYD